MGRELDLEAYEAERVLHELRLDTLPVDPLAVAADRQIDVMPKPADIGVSGMLIGLFLLGVVYRGLYWRYDPKSRANRREEWFKEPIGRVGVCNLTLPVREKAR